MPFDFWPSPPPLPPDLRFDPVRRALCRALALDVGALVRRHPERTWDVVLPRHSPGCIDVLAEILILKAIDPVRCRRAAGGQIKALLVVGGRLDGRVSTTRRVGRRLAGMPDDSCPYALPITTDEARLVDLERDPAKLLSLARPWSAAINLLARKTQDEVSFIADAEALEESKPMILVCAAQLLVQGAAGRVDALRELGDRLEGKPGLRRGEIDEVREAADMAAQATINELIEKLTHDKLSAPPDDAEIEAQRYAERRRRDADLDAGRPAAAEINGRPGRVTDVEEASMREAEPIEMPAERYRPSANGHGASYGAGSVHPSTGRSGNSSGSR